jgi:hypothetical protein
VRTSRGEKSEDEREILERRRKQLPPGQQAKKTSSLGREIDRVRAATAAAATATATTKKSSSSPSLLLLLSFVCVFA